MALLSQPTLAKSFVRCNDIQKRTDEQKTSPAFFFFFLLLDSELISVNEHFHVSKSKTKIKAKKRGPKVEGQKKITSRKINQDSKKTESDDTM